MSKVFEYFKKTGEIANGDGWDGDIGFDFEYEVEDNDLIDALSYIIYRNHFKGKEMRDFQSFYSQARAGLRDFLNNNEEILETLVESYEEELKEYFEEDALDSIE